MIPREDSLLGVHSMGSMAYMRVRASIFCGATCHFVGDAVLDILFLCIISCCNLLCLNICPCHTHMSLLVHLQLSKSPALANNSPTPATRTVLEVAALPIPILPVCSHCQCNIMVGG